MPPPVFSHLIFLERTDMTSLSLDLPVIGGWEFDSDKYASWPRFKQIELVKTIPARRLADPEETPNFLINNNESYLKMICY